MSDDKAKCQWVSSGREQCTLDEGHRMPHALASQNEHLSRTYGFGEPEPKKVEGPSMHDLVIEDMARRKEFGLVKYGTILQAGNGRNALQDAYEEVLDLAVYLRQRIAEDRNRERERAAKKPVLDPAIVEMVFPDPVPDEQRCPSKGPYGAQCIFRKGHDGRHRAANLNDVRKR